MASRALEALGRVPIFSELPQRHLRRILRSTATYTYQDGAAAVMEGTTSEGFYVILDGTAKVIRRGRTVDHMSAGDFFGEIALLDGGPRSASVVADGPLTCLILLRKEFNAILAQEPQVALRVLRGATARLRRVDHSHTS